MDEHELNEELEELLHSSKSRELDPLRPGINLVEVLLIFLACWTAIDMMVHPEMMKVSLEVSPVINYAWRVLILLGSSITLLGLFWPGESDTAVYVQIAGYAGLGFGALAYGTAASEWITLFFAAFIIGHVVLLKRRLVKFS